MNLLLNATPATESLGDILPLAAILPFVVMLLAIAILPLATPGWYGPLRNKAIVAAAFGVRCSPISSPSGIDRPREGDHHGRGLHLVHHLPRRAVHDLGRHLPHRRRCWDAAQQHSPSWPSARCWPTSSAPRAPRCCSSGRCSAPTPSAPIAEHIVVFLIFIVCNTGGLLTPLGDPPLFLGFLRGVDFSWTLRLWPQWLLAQAILLVAFFVVDSFYYRKEPPADQTLDETIRADPRSRAASTSLFLVGVIATTVISGGWHDVDKGGPTSTGSCATGLRPAAARARSTSARRSRGRSTASVDAHRRGGHRVRRHLRHHDPGPGNPRGARRRARRHASPGSSSGRRAACRRSSTTHPPTWCSPRSPRAC